ncbi:MAG: aminopeptidase P family protein [Sphingomonadales bacterium]|nr:aminopeptidase P family protein [Sphingomonadales bacterium]
MTHATLSSAARHAELHAAEGLGLALLDRIEALGLIKAGRTEREVEQDIYALARDEFGVEKHWHKRIVHAGVNGLATARENPPVLTIAEDDLVFLDLGPVFDDWEADVGRSYVVGDDPDKIRLIADLLAVRRRDRGAYRRRIPARASARRQGFQSDQSGEHDTAPRPRSPRQRTFLDSRNPPGRSRRTLWRFLRAPDVLNRLAGPAFAAITARDESHHTPQPAPMAPLYRCLPGPRDPVLRVQRIDSGPGVARSAQSAAGRVGVDDRGHSQAPDVAQAASGGTGA